MLGIIAHAWGSNITATSHSSYLRKERQVRMIPRQMRIEKRGGDETTLHQLPQLHIAQAVGEVQVAEMAEVGQCINRDQEH